MKKVIPLLFVLLLTNCGVQQPVAPIEAGWAPDPTNADYGQYPNNYVDIIKARYSATLKDPGSAQFVSFSRPRKENMVADQFQHQAAFGYSVCAVVNAKNSFGAYAGAQADWFFIRNGEILKQMPVSIGIIYMGHPMNCTDGD
jgi:hypothetical protein